MENLISAIEPSLIEKELERSGLFRTTNKADNFIYIVDSNVAPNTMLEIGRLREISFRSSGGGTGKSYDTDKFDYGDNAYHQLIVWNPEKREIVGGYRYIHGKNVKRDDSNNLLLTSAHLFDYSDRFVNEYLPKTIELGRSFVRPEYQSTIIGSKSLYALDNLWDGLGGLIYELNDTEYFFGKATVYPSLGIENFSLISFFLSKYFTDNECLVAPKKPICLNSDTEYFESLFSGTTFRDNYSILKKELKNRNSVIPPLLNAYMNLSQSMKVFGSAVNDEFSDVYEIGLLIKIDDIYNEKIERHLNTYCRINENLKL